LDIDTKRRIDTARDILVGKLPDPKSQVEQITIALIYKFMDDMDKQSEELGGKAKFFTGEFEKYSWSKIFDPRVSGFELVSLYAEAIEKMDHNPNIPPLFREIFKNAYLPYRDPETLRMFLKIIGEFEYDHSERLGDSYEQLLSIMGSQGDAGQFRTPRHIIDFMVEVTDPQKSETILDPACGTAGFLIFSYNHILNKNRVDNNVNLSPEERVNLVQNIVGYDISPDMVRIALVNMYLHGFQNPKIYEYDTLASEDRWNDYFDIILANPPFMSPRGGVRPHKRFSIQSKRSEVLFVDYIAEHLTPHGRGAVIIPEGIIFQSGTAYKKLRKSLIESSLYAVVSLPAGVFNPYSGVKTSILFLNKNFAKKADSILFVKVSNDGFGLGAQRRKIKENDLPIALEIIQEYQQSINENKEMEFNSNEIKLAHLVKKEKIAESGDYNLSGDRYKETVTYSGKWDFVELGEICEIYQPKTITQKEMAENGKYLVFGANGVIGKYHSYNHEDEEVLITCRGATCGTVNLSKPRSWITGNAMVVTPKNNMLNKKYLFYLLKHSNLKPIISGAAQPQITRQSLFPYNVPLPPLEIQEQIVDELESYQKIIDGAKQVVENYKPTFKIDPDWEMVEIGNICKNIKKIIDPKKLTGQINYIGLENISKNSGELLGNIKSEASSIKSMKLEFKKKNILYAKLRPNLNKVYYTEIEGICSTDIMVLMFDEKKSIPKLYSSILREQWFNKKVLNGLKGAQLPRISWDYFKMIKVPVPPMEAQKKIILKIENEQKMIDSNKELIKIYEQKIKDKIAEVWGE
jgi:type I restriction enzyme M protein